MRVWKYHDTKFLVVILALQILASLVVGALGKFLFLKIVKCILTRSAATIHTCLAKRVEDSETADSDSVSTDDGDSNSSRRSNTPAPPDGTRSAQTGSLRNFSLPRERCLDVAPPVSTRALPTAPQYIATGIVSSAQHVIRSLPTPPFCGTDDEVPAPTDQQVEDLVVQPLDICKIQKRKSQMLVKAATKERLSQSLAMHLTVEAGSNICFFPSPNTDEDKLSSTKTPLSSNAGLGTGTGPADLETPASSFEVNHVNNSVSPMTCFPPLEAGQYEFSIATVATRPHSQDTAIGPTEDVSIPPMVFNNSEASQAPEHPATSAIQLEESTPVTPPVVDTSSLSPTKLATIRLVKSFLEMPQEVDHASLVRKWKGQQSFISF